MNVLKTMGLWNSTCMRGGRMEGRKDREYQLNWRKMAIFSHLIDFWIGLSTYLCKQVIWGMKLILYALRSLEYF